jgi:hypothetical protein
MSSEPTMGNDIPAGGAVPELRASHADRDHTVEILRIAAGDGRLTADELDQRLEAALTARTYRELAALTADLPPSSPALSGPRAVVPVEPKDVVRIAGKGSNIRRAGSWVVPKALEISVSGGTVKLDFTEAVITEPLLRINAMVRGGWLVLVTRPGIEVDASEVTLIGAQQAKIWPEGGWSQPAQLRIEVSGENHGGFIVVRPPRRSFGQWLRRRPRPYSESITS